ncbi:hypothetical protein S40293_00344 [Stachybotrys chartarum IBT 40293]|nr:hypothetical protein S40293_00344 [Stachybotrys chartarum IBT 40293]
MPSPRQLRLVMTATLVTVVLIMFFTSGMPRHGDNAGSIQDFYHKTVQAMDGKSPRGQAVLNSQTGEKAGQIPADKDADGDVDADDMEMARQMQERLKAAEQQAKDKANEKGGLRPDPPSNVIGVGSSADGQHKKGKGHGTNDGVADPGTDDSEESAEQHQAEVELNAILKKSPVIIFSKTYCPYSKRAKGVLLDKYSITPDPFVVELDEHPLGPLLQEQLLQTTGRRTVPNIMINGVSIGGADDIIQLDNDDELVKKVLDLGSKRVEIAERTSVYKPSPNIGNPFPPRTMGRASVSSDAASVLSETTTADSYAKEPEPAPLPDGKQPQAQEQRRGLRRRARDLVADMGRPPTRRHDAKMGKATKRYDDMGMLGAIITAKAGKI